MTEMRWQERTDNAYNGQVEDALFPAQLKRLLVGRTITKVEDVEGRPGGANNDRVTLSFSDGSILRIDAYSGGDIYATVTEREDL
jgi:hypothetical protein